MRVVCWFSCGAASAVATKLAIGEFKGHEIIIAYTEVAEEHPDNKRFLADCEKWFGQKILVLKNEKYSGSIYEVFRKERFLVGPGGAACTKHLKKGVRKSFEKPGDKQVFGYTVEEQGRVDRFIDANNDVDLHVPLIDRGLAKGDCLAILKGAAIELPEMYKLGYRNNNCIGCVKGGSGYWNKIRIDFPETFERMAKAEEYLGRTVCKISVDGESKRVSLRELPPSAGEYESEPDMSCGIFCHMAEQEIK